MLYTFEAENQSKNQRSPHDEIAQIGEAFKSNLHHPTGKLAEHVVQSRVSGA